MAAGNSSEARAPVRRIVMMRRVPDPPDPPGAARPRRYVPRLHWELIACGTRGHLLAGTDAAELRPEDAILARAGHAGARWYRCLRCDSWVSLPAPVAPGRPFPPGRDELELPLRGRPLRDKIVLRLIALDRALHFLLLGTLAILIFAFLENEDDLRGPVVRAITDLQNGLGGAEAGDHGLLADVRRLFSIHHGTLERVGVVVALFAIVEGVEAVGLWRGKRWAEYLTFLVTAALLPLEMFELSERFSPLKVLTLLINLAVVVYLIYAKRLFGIRGGGAAEAALHDRDTGWPAVEVATPP
jgi:hypothetical protein